MLCKVVAYIALTHIILYCWGRAYIDNIAALFIKM